MAKPSEPGSDAGTRAAVVAVACSAAVLTLAALVTFGLQTAFGVATGGLLATANLMVFVRAGKAFLDKKGTAPWAMIAVLKFLLLFGGVWMILRTGIVSPLALAFGYGSLPIGITLGGLFGPKPPEDAPEP